MIGDDALAAVRCSPMSPRRPPLRRLAYLAVAAALLVAAGCSKSDGGSDGTVGAGDTRPRIASPATVDQTTTAAGPATPSTASTTTTGVTVPPPATPPPPTGEASPRAAADRLYETWKAGDRPSALVVATPEAVDGIWATAPGDYVLYNDCDSAEFDTSGCLFRGDSGTIQFTMERQGQAWVVIEALFSAP